MNSGRELGLEALDWDELAEAVEQFIAADGPNTSDLPVDDFVALWARFEVERRQRLVEVEGEIVGEEVRLSLASSSISGTEVEDGEIRLPDGTRIVLRFRTAQPTLHTS